MSYKSTAVPIWRTRETITEHAMSIENMSQRQNSEIENGASLSVAPSISGKAVPKAAGPVGSHAFQPKYQKLMVQHYVY